MAKISATQKMMLVKMNAYQEERMARQEVTKANPQKMVPNPEKMESQMEHHEVPMEETTVKSSGIMKKQHRGWHLAAEQCGEPKEVTQGNCVSQIKLVATYRKVPCCVAVAGRKRNIFSKILTQGYCEPQKEDDPLCRSGTHKRCRLQGHSIE